MTATPPAAPLVELEHVSRYYEHPGIRRRRAERFAAVDDVSLSIAAGETVAVVGESGSGKSTIGRMILGLTAVSEGVVRFDGRDVTRRTATEQRALTRDIQVVFQDPYSSLNPRQRVREIIREPLDIHRIGTGRERDGRVAEVMAQVALPERLASFYPHQLSGGLRQRVSIATSLVIRPKLIVADEPVSALDVSVQSQILELFTEIQRQTSVAVMFISHDLSVVRQVSERVLVLRRGRVVESGAVEDVFARPAHPYTRALLSAVPPADPRAPFEPIVFSDDSDSDSDGTQNPAEERG